MTTGKADAKVRFPRRLFGPVVLLLILLFAALVVLGSMLPSRRNHPPITIILRYDDYSAVSNTFLESRILKELDRYQLPCIFAAIPCVTSNGFRNASPADSLLMDADKVALLRPYVDKGLIEVCVHGCTHQTVAGKDLHSLTEFQGRPYEEQLVRLNHAKSVLETQFGKPVVTFVPPWGNYDDNTLLAAQVAGFTIISADPRGPVATGKELVYVPGTCRIHQLADAIKEAKRLPSSGSTVITAVIHPYDFVESDANRGILNFAQFQTLLAEISSDPGLRFTTASGATRLLSDLSAERLTKTSMLRNSSVTKLLPEFLQLSYPSKSYVDAKLATTLLERERVWCVAVYLVGFCGAMLVANRTRRFLPPNIQKHRKTGLIVGALLLVAITAYSLIDLQIYAAGLTTIVGMLGLLLGSALD